MVGSEPLTEVDGERRWTGDWDREEDGAVDEAEDEDEDAEDDEAADMLTRDAM